MSALKSSYQPLLSYELLALSGVLLMGCRFAFGRLLAPDEATH